MFVQFEMPKMAFVSVVEAEDFGLRIYEGIRYENKIMIKDVLEPLKEVLQLP